MHPGAGDQTHHRPNDVRFEPASDRRTLGISVHGGIHVPAIVGLGSEQRSARPWRCHEPVLGIAGLGVSAMTLYAIEVWVVLGAFVVMYVASVHHRREQEDHQDPGPDRSRPAR